MDRDLLLRRLKTDEGTGPVKLGRLLPYKDSRGVLTIGYGTNLAEGLSFPEAEYLLNNRVDETIHALCRQFPGWFPSLDPIRQAALVNVAYNLGAQGLVGFTRMIAALRVSDYHTAAAELLDSDYAEQVGARARRNAAQLETGAWA